MSARGHVIMFQERFAPLVESGRKPHTIRPERKRRILVGDTLDLRAWAGKPYRSKQRKLRVARCTDRRAFALYVVQGRAMLTIGMSTGAITLQTEAAEALARGDGFADVAEMVAWFQQMHGLPFRGVLIRWD